MSRNRAPRVKRKTILIVLFIPGVDRNSRPIDQSRWERNCLKLLGKLFGGATAFPRAQGVWRDDERAGALVWDRPVIVHCYAAEKDLARRASRVAIGDFCQVMGRETNQGEVGLIIDNVYHAIKPEQSR